MFLNSQYCAYICTCSNTNVQKNIMKSKINAVTTKKAIEILGCTRSTFYYSYKRKLEVLGKEKNDILYKESDVLLLKEEIELIKNKFNIIK